MYPIVLDLTDDTVKIMAIMYFQSYRLRENEYDFFYGKLVNIYVKTYSLKFFSIEKDGRIVKRKTQSLSVNEVFVAFL